MQEDDGLPSGVCTKCENKINVAYELREQCQKADKELRKLYGITLSTNITDNFNLTKVYIYLSINEKIISALLTHY